MKKTVNIALVLLFLAILFSCSQSAKTDTKRKIIDVASSIGGGKIIDISDIVSDIKYIPLETSSVSLLSDITQVYFENDLIYVRDRSDGLSIFNKEGKFLKKFSRRGRGPEEYPYSMEIYLNPKNQNIIVNSMDDFNNVIRYDSSGKLIGKFRTPRNDKFSTQPPYLLDNNTYIATIGLYRDNPEFSAVVYDSTGTPKLFIPIPKLAPYKKFIDLSKLDSPIESLAIRSSDGNVTMGQQSRPTETTIHNPDMPFLYRYKDNIRLVYDSNDTIFSLSNNLQIDTPFVFNYGTYKNSSSDMTGISAAKGKHISLFGRKKIMESDDFLFLNFALRDYAHEPYEKTRPMGKGTYALNNSYAIYNKKKELFSLLNQPEKGVLGLKENLMDGPPFWPTYISYDNYLVMSIPAYSLIEYSETHTVSAKLAEIIKKIKDSDNPIIVLAK